MAQGRVPAFDYGKVEITGESPNFGFFARMSGQNSRADFQDTLQRTGHPLVKLNQDLRACTLRYDQVSLIAYVMQAPNYKISIHWRCNKWKALQTYMKALYAHKALKALYACMR